MGEFKTVFDPLDLEIMDQVYRGRLGACSGATASNTQAPPMCTESADSSGWVGAITQWFTRDD